MTPLVLTTWVAVVALVGGEIAGRRPWVRVAKPLASTGFVAVALAAGALDGPYGRAVLAALVLSWFGDVFLLSRRRPAFLSGLVAFLLGHLAYAVGFTRLGVERTGLTVATVALIAAAALVGRWLLPRVEPGLRGPVLAYIGVISVMVATAAGATASTGRPELLVGAFGFYLSDLAVALDRFVAPGPHNKVWGLPLYYGAQLVLAASVAG